MSESKQLIVEHWLVKHPNFSEQVASELIKAIFSSITSILVTEGQCGLPHLGRFIVEMQPECEGFNPTSGQTITIPAKKVVVLESKFSLTNEDLKPETIIVSYISKHSGFSDITEPLIVDFFNIILSILQEDRKLMLSEFGVFRMRSDEIVFRAGKEVMSQVNQEQTVVYIPKITTNKIFEAIASDSLDNNKLTELLQSGEDINERNEVGASPLTMACEQNNLELARLLLEAGADVNNYNSSLDEENFDENDIPSPLHIAIHNNHIDLVQLLLAFNANIYRYFDNQYDAFTTACQHKNLNILICLFQHEAKNQPAVTTEGIKAAVTEKIMQHKNLKQHQQMLNIVQEARFKQFGMAETDDQVEAMVIELNYPIKMNIEYLHQCNWTYGDLLISLKSIEEKKEKEILIANEGQLNYREDGVTLQSLQDFCQLAKQLNLENLTIKEFTEFVIILVSRQVQTGDIESPSKHSIMHWLDPEEAPEPDEKLLKYFEKMPIKDIIF